MRALILAAAGLSACASAPPGHPRIDRLPESALGPIAPAKTGPYTLEEVAAMARAGETSQVMVQKLRDSRTPYGGLSSDQSASLARQGVPGDVLVWLRFGDRAPSPAVRHGARDACRRDPFCGHPGYGFGYPGYARPYGYGYPPHRSGLYFGHGLRR